MDVRKRLFSNMFFRNMISDLFGRSAGHREPGGFTPYFQYKIASYNTDFYLYFPKEPYAIRYKNEIFNKLDEYYDADIIYFLEFHYSAYPDKQDFIKFFRYELYGRLNRKITVDRRRKLLFAQEWVLEKQKDLQAVQHADIKMEIAKEVRKVLPADASGNTAEVENLSLSLSEKLAERMEKILSITEERMLSITDSFVTGNIELNNQNHQDKLIKLFKLLKDVRAPKELARTEQLFKKFSDTDIAAILRLHFKGFNKQLNSIQKSDIKKADESISNKNPKLKKLEEALSEFFYS